MATAYECTWGSTISFRGSRVPTSTMEQGLPRIGTGQDIERSSQVGQTKMRHSDYSDGLTTLTGVQPWAQTLRQYSENQGIQTRLPGLAILPYALTTQAALAAVDISASVAANIRVHSIASSLGATGLRTYFVVDKRLYRDTSLTDPALVAVETMTDTITAIDEVVFNNIAYLAIAGENTDNIKGTTDPTASPPTWVELVSLSAGDRIDAMRYMPAMGPGVGIAIGKVGGTTGVWYWYGTDTVPATLRPVVVAGTKDEPNLTGTLLNTGVKYPISATQQGGTLWTDLVNILTDNGLNTTNAAAGTSTKAYTYNFALNIPENADLSGIVVEIEKFESNADDNIVDNTVRLYSGLTQATGVGTLTEDSNFGIDKADATTEWVVTTPTIVTYGASNNLWGASLTPLIVNNPGFGVAFASSGPGATPLASVDFIRMTGYYRMPGTTIAFPLGGYTCQESLAFPHRIAYVTPKRNDTTAITVPRKLWFLDMDWDTTGNRPVMTVTAPGTNMPNIHSIVPYQGGYAVAGGPASGPARYVRYLDANNQVKNFDIPKKNGATEFRVNSMFAQGSWLICDMISTALTDRQWWYFNNGKWYADTLLQSKTTSAASIALQPIPFAEQTLGLHQNQIYTLFPKTTNTAVTRQFLPGDLGADPRLIDTAEVKSMAFTATVEDTGLYLVGVEKDWGPEEANKTIVTFDMQTRDISATSTVKYELSLDGGTTFNASLTKEFTSALQHFDVLSSGVAFETVKERLTLKHTAANAATPNGTGVLVTSIQQWPSQDTIEFEVDPDSAEPDIHTLRSAVYSLQDTKNVQPLVYADLNIPCVFEGAFFTSKVAPRGQPPVMEHFRDYDKKGVPQDMSLRLRFRKVPGTAATS